jgi:hypothetical protein
MELSYLLVQLLGEYVDLTLFVLVSGSVLPKINLGKYLVGE